GHAVAGGELPRDTDIDQLVFEITAMLVRANFTWVVTGEARVLEQARIGIGHVLERVAGHTESESRSSDRRARASVHAPGPERRAGPGTAIRTKPSCRLRP